MAARLDAPSTGIEWVDSLIRTFRSDPMGGLGPAPIATSVAGVVSPGVRRGLRFVAEQAAERIPSRARLAELLGRSAKIKPMTEPLAEIPSPNVRALGEMADTSLGPRVAEYMSPEELKHYVNLVNNLMRLKGSPAAVEATQAGAYELLLLELLSGRLP